MPVAASSALSGKEQASGNKALVPTDRIPQLKELWVPALGED